MPRTRTYSLDRRSRAKVQALWKPEYDELAQYNGAKAFRAGCVTTPYPERYEMEITPGLEARMAEIQCDYDENYRPASQRIWDGGTRRRRWWFW